MRRCDNGEEGVAAPLRVAVIIGSTREGRLGDAIARWFVERAAKRDDLAVSVVDLADFDFPARYPDRVTEPMAEFTAEVDRAEAFVVVTPEYNRSFPASLKQAVDYAYDEWQTKPVAFVSYGHGSGGLYAVEGLRSVFTELHTVTLRNGVSINLFDCGDDVLDVDAATEEHRDRAASVLLDQLGWWGLALREARKARPYIC
ncbi:MULTISPECIES: NADPH-dependent FMN reductase [Streptomyces]|uniref:NADPH-dependent FMN reductase n=1 Tax=Streptomyces TaxID=1883 RepID=UPI00084C5493|nr:MULTISPECIES: NAD(P)H-dependent oxidoreductase [Streptomyces]TFI30912.1 NADPH-dependent oxidoreductase [Streptomyces sp. 4R-3d]